MFNINIKEIAETELTNTGSFLQTPFWANFKSFHGWSNKRFLVAVDITQAYKDIYGNSEKVCDDKNYLTKDDKIIKTFEISVLIRKFFKQKLSIAYVPLSPKLLFNCTSDEKLDNAFTEEGVSLIDETIVTAETQTIEFANFLNDLAIILKNYLPKNTICVRFDPAIEFTDPFIRDNFNQGVKMVCFADRLKLRKNRVDIQPPDSTLINLLDSEEEILEKMKSKWRYNIRLAEKKGVIIEKIDGSNEKLSEYIDIFYELYKTTAERDGIGIHSKSYYLDLLKQSSEQIKEGKDVPLVSLYFARHEEDYLASIITLFSKTESVYLYGCSSNVKRNYMPSYLLQWNAIKGAKSYGSSYYDMYGIPPTDDDKHPMHGLYLFKTGFGGKNIHRPGSFDVPISLFYSVYNLIEKFRAFYYKKIKKIIRGR